MGNNPTRSFYYAYGSPREGGGCLPTDKLFTGQQLDNSTGLYYYNARLYDPLIGRFVSADTIVPDPKNPQALNRYSYTYNNPLKYIDSGGHFPILVVVAIPILLKAIDYGWTAYDAWQSGQVLADPNASAQAKQEAATNLAMTAAFEAMEPDDFLPIALPLDDLARKGILTGLKLPLPGMGGSAVRQGAQFIKGVDSVVNGERVRRISSPLSDPSLKRALHDEARSIYDAVNPGRRHAHGLDVHHRIPLEWAHLFPDADPNRLSNLVGLPGSVHDAVTARWNSWRAGLGHSPTAAEVQDFARQIDDEFSTDFR